MTFAKSNSSTKSTTSSLRKLASTPNEKATRMPIEKNKVSKTVLAISKSLLRGAKEAQLTVEELNTLLKNIDIKNIETNYQIGGMTKDITHNIDKMVSSAESVVSSLLVNGEEISIAKESAREIFNSLTELSNYSEQVAKNIEDLNASSRSISEVNSLINRVANQANILSLNASIESIHAKEHAEGFRLIANETRLLALQTQASSTSFKELFYDIESSIIDTKAVVGSTSLIASKAGESAIGLKQKIDELSKTYSQFKNSSDDIFKLSSKLNSSSIRTNSSTKALINAIGSQADSIKKISSTMVVKCNLINEINDYIFEIYALCENIEESNGGERLVRDIVYSIEAVEAVIVETRESFSDSVETLSDIENLSYLAEKSALVNRESVNETLNLSLEVDTFIDNMGSNFENLEAVFIDIKELTSGAGAIFSQVEKSSERADVKLNEIKKSRRKIDKIVRNIYSDIMQFSMLAISGEIEANRAKEHGRGIELVSSNIRTFATDSKSVVAIVDETVELMSSSIESIKDSMFTAKESRVFQKNAIELLRAQIEKTVRELKFMIERYYRFKAINSKSKDWLEEVLGANEQIQKIVEQGIVGIVKSRRAAELALNTIIEIEEGLGKLRASANRVRQSS